MLKMNFENRIAVITGGASGIGLGVAKYCVKKKMRIILADIEKEAMINAENELKQIGGDVIGVLTDVSIASQVEHLANMVFHQPQDIGFLFLNAGVNVRMPLWQHSLNDWEWLIGVNLMGIIHGIKYFIPKMIEQNSESYLVTNASIMGLMKGSDAYSVTKHAIIALTEALSGQVKSQTNKLKVAVLCPAFVKSEILSAERNRPNDLKDQKDTISMEEWSNIETMRKMNEMGMDPVEVAEILFEGLSNDVFYILTDKNKRYARAIKSRMNAILEAFEES